ncbi:processing peptidase [Leptolyngbya sp. Heron Island J]|uniref:M16 family metallopeptidase n=1 Tax=Leptolyngbya sp. Heron Island J TaxID=1385935 RepID=UPI0003B971A4|nr:pitrilysin family protein [Leptolyngbya sp. Heron Island J]ESA39034.1 processing peptidase [Leptolyngbya sp. Heron Island J]
MTVSTAPKQNSITTHLGNGLKVIAIENSAADIVSARLFLPVGQGHETPENAGILSLLTSLLTRGTTHRNSLDIAEAVEYVGASVGADSASDYSVVSVKTVSADFEEIFTLATEIIREPSFPENEIELERKLTIQGLRSMQEQPFSVAYKYFREGMYGSHPYGFSSMGTEENVMAIQRDHLLEAHSKYFRPDNMVVIIVGRIDPEKAVALVDKLLGDWKAPDYAAPEAQLPPLESHAYRIVTPQETNQAFVIIGYLAASVKHPDFAALKLLSTHLGNGLSSRLFVELREKQGLAYDVSAFYPTRLGPSQFVSYIGTAPENTSVALDGLQSELRRLCEIPLTAHELQVAKNKILGQYALGKQTNGQIAQLLGWYEILGLGTEYDEQFQTNVTAVTIEEAQAAAKRCFVDSYISILGPATAVEPLR